MFKSAVILVALCFVMIAECQPTEQFAQSVQNAMGSAGQAVQEGMQAVGQGMSQGFDMAKTAVNTGIGMATEAMKVMTPPKINK